MKPAGGKPTSGMLHVVCLLLLLCTAQLLWALVWSHGLFLRSAQALISPFHSCLRGQDGVLVCNDSSDGLGDAGGPDMSGTIPRVLVILGLYTPLVLVPFSLLGLWSAVRWGEGGLLGFSVVCQAASSLLILLGVMAFLALHWAHVSLAALTAELYVCVSVCVELAVCVSVCGAGRGSRGELEGREKAAHVEHY